MREPEHMALFVVYSLFVVISLKLCLLLEASDKPDAVILQEAKPTSVATLPSLRHLSEDSIDETVIFTNGLEQLPASLQGTEVPDGLEADHNGNLVITPQFRDVLDYFLSTLGEEPLDTIEQRLRAYFANSLPATAAGEASRILEGYLAWKENLAHISEAGGTSADHLDLRAVQAQQQTVRDSCIQYLDRQVCTAFFARQKIHEDYVLDRLAVVRDDTLTTREKEQHLAALTASLPDAMQQTISQTTGYQRLQRLTAKSHRDNQGTTDLRQIREQWVGTEATKRLEKLDARREIFDQRMAQWLELREALLNNASLSRSDRQQQVDQLRKEHFTAREQVRVQARERIADQT